MKKEEAILLLTDAMVEYQKNPAGLLDFIEGTLRMRPYKYTSSGCLCGHFDVCHCGPGTYEFGWFK